MRLAAVNEVAKRLGLAPGITLADARARIPGLAVVAANARADDLFLEKLAGACERFAPSVAVDPPAGLLLDTTGCAHLFGGEAALKHRVRSLFSDSGLAVGATIAGTPEAARALVRCGWHGIATPENEESIIRQMPVVALNGMPSETTIALRRAGLKTLGALADRPAASLAARFGQAFVTELSRTLGRETAGIAPLRPAPQIFVARTFAEPLTQTEAIEGVLGELIGEASQRLQEMKQGGRAFEASFFRSDGAVRRLCVETGRPLRDPPTLMRLYRERLATLADPIDPGFGFDVIRLAVVRSEALGDAQVALDATAEDETSVPDLIDRLVVRFGPEHVVRFEPQDTHDPRLASRIVQAAATSAAPAARIVWPAPEPGEPPARPLQLFDPPQPIDAMAEVPDGPPVRFRWRRVVHHIARAEGPERIAPEWWRSSAPEPTRDYYRAEDTAGCRFWIFREGLYGEDAAPRWYLHGLFA